MSADRRNRVYRDPLWRHLRAVVLARARNQCERCGASGVRLDVDHVVPIAQAPERAFDRANLRALCQRCHRITDADRQRGYSLDAGADGWPADSRHPARGGIVGR